MSKGKMEKLIKRGENQNLEFKLKVDEELGFLRIGKGKRELKYILVLMQNTAKIQQKSGEEGRAVTHVFR